MKNIITVLALFFSITLFSQTFAPENMVNQFTLDSAKFTSIVTHKDSRIKLSEKEIAIICKIIGERQEEYFRIIEEYNKTIPYGENGLPTGKGDMELFNKKKNIKYEVCMSVCEFLGYERSRQLHRTLMEAWDRSNAEGLKKALQNRKNKKKASR